MPEQMVADLRDLTPEELSRVWGFALGLKSRHDMDAAKDQAA